VRYVLTNKSAGTSKSFRRWLRCRALERNTCIPPYGIPPTTCAGQPTAPSLMVEELEELTRVPLLHTARLCSHFPPCLVNLPHAISCLATSLPVVSCERLKECLVCAATLLIPIHLVSLGRPSIVLYVMRVVQGFRLNASQVRLCLLSPPMR